MAESTTDLKEQEAPNAGSARRRKPGLILTICSTGYLVVLLAVAAGDVMGPERWWFGSLNLYLPQWIWAIPAILLVPAYLITAPRWSFVPAAMLLIVLGPLMGFCWPWPGGQPSSGPGIRLRLLTYNVKWAGMNVDAIADEIQQDHPDIVMMQDAAGALDGKLRPCFTGWYVLSVDQYIVASRYPILAPEIRWITVGTEWHRVLRCTALMGDRKVTLYDCHLLTPRWGLGALRHPRSAGVAALNANVEERLEQAGALADHVRRETGPIILAGDLNSPVQSLACRRLFAVGLRDAFSQAGRGYGYTYGQTTRIGRPYVRIDHIMVNQGWSVLSCRAGNSVGSAHCPVVADLFLPAHS
jgi:endonuclease/exonuclease/phosphatase (EEP) superfamily protein YafD